jgi:hypothetical protein
MLRHFCSAFSHWSAAWTAAVGEDVRQNWWKEDVRHNLTLDLTKPDNTNYTITRYVADDELRRVTHLKVGFENCHLVWLCTRLNKLSFRKVGIK